VEYKNKVKDTVNYNQLVDELLTTCNPHSYTDKEVPKAISKPSPICFLPLPDQRLNTEEAKHPHEDLGAYCKFRGSIS